MNFLNLNDTERKCIAAPLAVDKSIFTFSIMVDLKKGRLEYHLTCYLKGILHGFMGSAFRMSGMKGVGCIIDMPIR